MSRTIKIVLLSVFALLAIGAIAVYFSFYSDRSKAASIECITNRICRYNSQCGGPSRGICDRAPINSFEGSRMIGECVCITPIPITDIPITDIPTTPTPYNDNRACPLDIKICPDGSTVPRIGPNCEFAPCSTTPNPTTPTPYNDNPAYKYCIDNGGTWRKVTTETGVEKWCMKGKRGCEAWAYFYGECTF